MGYALYVKSGSIGMVSSITTSTGGFIHLFSLETETHYALLRASLVAPLDKTLAHTYQ
jgi:hypothetical protein